MQMNNMDSRRSKLEQLSTEELDRMLQAEMEKETAEPEEVKRILNVLKEREKDVPVLIGEKEEALCQRYIDRVSDEERKPIKSRGAVIRAACIAVALLLVLAAVSSSASADSFWERVARWTDSVFGFFGADDPTDGETYEFQTEHPGLQQVYDAVAALGITDPVVPMWIPEGYELIVCKKVDTEKKSTVMAAFQNGDKVISFNVDIYSEDVTNQYQKDDTETKVFEHHGTKYHIVKNNTMWVAVWTMRNIECSISAACQEDELYKIIFSIYDKEEAK